MITREKAIELLHNHTQNQNLRRHMYAVGAVMKALAFNLWDANKLAETDKRGNTCAELAEAWEKLGLLHDADWEETKDAPNEHTRRTLEWLKDLGEIDGPIVHALMSHNTKLTHLAELTGAMEWALETCDELTGFIVAVALVRPEKKLETVTVDSVLKKWKNKEFAKAVDRGQIAQCEEKLGIPLKEYIQIVLSAMQAISQELGL